MKINPIDQSCSVAFYPSLAQMANNPYWAMLASGLKENGVTVIEEPVSYTIKWLIQNKDKVNVLHLHYFQSLYCNSGHTRARLFYVLRFGFHLLLARRLGFRTILTVHNLEPTQTLKPGWVDYLGHWVAVNLSERVIVHCKEARRLVRSRYGRNKAIFEVPHPNYIDRYPNQISKEDARKKLSLGENNCVFLFLGGIRPNKGIGTLIEAFENIKNDSYSLVIAGNPGEQTAYAESLKKMAEGDERIKFFLDFIPDDKLQVFCNACDIVVLPFARVLTSGSAFLAMSFARPIIAPKMGCLLELVASDAGWLYEPGNKDSFAEKMCDAASSNYVNKGVRAYQSVNKCTIAEFASQTCKCYESRKSEV